MKALTIILLIFLTIEGCDGDDNGMDVIRPCNTLEDIVNSACPAPNIVVPPGVCEPLLCASEGEEFVLPPEDEFCEPVGCFILDCRESGTMFTGLEGTEEGFLIGNIIIGGESAAFECFQ